ncbi:hypothetical protein CYY_009146 [Polysphondylium violaceum]|uniref:Transmembrane protein n=1 Tax=Polysphondylium violaceum TaxID=133409 RepID=A0A8J4UWG8_9MYCE|nr:hypothetical protein CYY_009146 [Polysphondylium violaceum]
MDNLNDKETKIINRKSRSISNTSNSSINSDKQQQQQQQQQSHNTSIDKENNQNENNNNINNNNKPFFSISTLYSKYVNNEEEQYIYTGENDIQLNQSSNNIQQQSQPQSPQQQQLIIHQQQSAFSKFSQSIFSYVIRPFLFGVSGSFGISVGYLLFDIVCSKLKLDNKP